MTPDLPPPVPPATPPPIPAYAPEPYSPGYPYPYRDQRQTDADHLRLLSIFSYVSAGLAVLGLGFVVMHYTMMNTMMNHAELFEGARRGSQPNPAVMFQQLFGVFRWFYLVFGLWGIVMAMLNVFAGYFLGQRRHRMFCLCVAGANCLRIPLGTALGIFTLMVLMRDSVRTLFVDENAGPASRSNQLPS